MVSVLDRPIFPPTDPVEQEELDRLVILFQKSQTPALVGPDGDHVQLPPAIYEVLTQVIKAMRAGRAITVAPLAQRLTTQEAADLLGISRPTLVTLLEEGKIPFEQPGRHRRVRLIDVLEYQEHQSAERAQALDELVRETEELGLYDDQPNDPRQ